MGGGRGFHDRFHLPGERKKGRKKELKEEGRKKEENR
jgi:hypothetical protein